MEKKLGITLVAVALLTAVGCTKPATTTAPTTTAATPPATTEPGIIHDSEVIQTAAIEEQPLATTTSGEVGAYAPAWENLTGTDDKQHSSKDLAEADAVAVVFTCNTCPVAVAYEDRLALLAKDYEDKKFALVAINVNKSEANQLPAMKERAEEKGFTFAYLFDPSQKIARDFGATVTPHAFVLNKERKVVYAGAIDDNQDSTAVKQAYLRDAIDATLAGQQPTVTENKPVGCGIQYE